MYNIGPKILTGSQYFFHMMPGFQPSDIDYVQLIAEPHGFKYVCQYRDSKGCIFKWKKMTPQEYIDYALHNGPAMQIGKFLTPEFAAAIDFTIDHLKQLTPLVNQLDDKHMYQKIIFDAYIENNSFSLTEEQRLQAYNEYLRARTKEEK